MRTLFLALALAFAASGCGTVHQGAVESRSAGFYTPPVAIAGGYRVDDAFRDRYNALVATYGHKKLENGAPVFTPPLERDDGVTPLSAGQWKMTLQAMENMVLLSDMRRRGSAP